MLRQLVIIPGLLLGMLGLILIQVAINGGQHPRQADAVQIDILSLAVDR